MVPVPIPVPVPTSILIVVEERWSIRKSFWVEYANYRDKMINPLSYHTTRRSLAEVVTPLLEYHHPISARFHVHMRLLHMNQSMYLGTLCVGETGQPPRCPDTPLRVNCRVWKSPSCPGVFPFVSG